ncbi:MAG: hypothetical protein AB7I18_11920 [Candidatus Berkiella sp.]
MSLFINTTWTHLQSVVDSKHLPIQYKYDSDGYNIWAIDNGTVYQTVIYNNAVPDPALYSQVQNDADKALFLSDYAPIANRVMQVFAARDGYTTDLYPALSGGTDGGGIVRIFRTDTSSRQVFVGAGTAGTPTGGVLTVQGDPAGTPIPISGTVTASNPSVGTNNAAAPTSSTQIGGSDGTNLQAGRVYDVDSGAGSEYVLGMSLRKTVNGGSVEYGTSTDPIRVDPTGTTAQPVTDNGGSLTVDGTVAVSSVAGDVTVVQPTAANLNATVVQPTAANLNAQVQGTAADGAAPVGNPVLVAGQDGTNVQSLKTDTTGRLEMVGAANDGSTPSGAPVLTAGWDGTNVQTFATDGYGSQIVTGRDAVGTPPTNNPVVIGGWDGTNVVRLRLNANGTVATSQTELATFTVAGTAVAPANNKSMISIFNADATLLTKVHEIYVVNVRTTAVTGVVGTFELRRITSHSGGTLLTPVSMDTADSLDSDITVRTGSTVGGEDANLMWRSLFSTDDWGPGTSDTESTDHIFQTMHPIFSRKTDSGTKPLVLRQNEGLTVKFATNSTAGTFDLFLVFTQE